jgi:hypothetical protein
MKLLTSTVLFVSALAGSCFCYAHGPDDPSMPVVRHIHEHERLKSTSYDAAAGDFGGVAPGSDSGGPTTTSGAGPSTCVGPVSYCTPFFGS